MKPMVPVKFIFKSLPIVFLSIFAAGMAKAASATSSPTDPLPDKTAIETNSKKGTNPFTLNLTIGFPANISDKPVSAAPAPVRSDSTPPPPCLARIYQYEVNPELGPNTTWHHTRAALNEAMDMKADMVYIHLSPFADFNSTAMDIGKKLSEFNKPMTVFLDRGNNTGGAIISVKGENIPKSISPTVQKAAVVKVDNRQIREKYKTYVSSLVEQNAEKKKSSSASLNAPSPSMMDFESIQPQAHATVVSSKGNIFLFHYQATGFERFLDFIMQPFMSLLLILLMSTGLLLELRSPGTGFPFFGSIAASLLFFVPLFLEGMASSFEIILFTAAAVLFVGLNLLRRPRGILYFLSIATMGIALLLCLTPEFQVDELSRQWIFLLRSGLIVCAAFYCTHLTNRFLNRRRPVISTQLQTV